MRVLFDTNILIDYLAETPSAKEEIEKYDDPAISLITWMEVLVGAESQEEEGILKNFLSRFRLIGIDQGIAESAIDLRKKYRLKIPDALIWASAQVSATVLVTANKKDFPKHPGIHFPY